MTQSIKINSFIIKARTSGVLGYFSKTTDSSIIEATSNTGMDFVIIDMEHGPVTTETLKHHLMACKSSDFLSIVRVDSYDSNLIGKALDLGANGIQIPSVSKVEQVKEILNRSKFHPEGARGVCRFVRAAEYAHKDQYNYFKDANSNLIIVQLEGVDGINIFEEIIKFTGIDIIFIGPYDLSQSIGFPGQIDHPKIIETIKNLSKMAKEHDILLGTFCDSPDDLLKWKKLGINYLAYSVDIALFADKLKELNNIRK